MQVCGHVLRIIPFARVIIQKHIVFAAAGRRLTLTRAPVRVGRGASALPLEGALGGDVGQPQPDISSSPSHILLHEVVLFLIVDAEHGGIPIAANGAALGLRRVLVGGVEEVAGIGASDPSIQARPSRRRQAEIASP
jgi:hypothetical protein